MKKKLRSGLILLFSMLTLNAFGQYDFVQTVDGNQYWLDIETEDFDEIAVPDGRRSRRISKSDIVLIEYMEEGLKILQKDKIRKVDPVAFSDNVEEFVKQGGIKERMTAARLGYRTSERESLAEARRQIAELQQQVACLRNENAMLCQ